MAVMSFRTNGQWLTRHIINGIAACDVIVHLCRYTRNTKIKQSESLAALLMTCVNEKLS